MKQESSYQEFRNAYLVGVAAERDRLKAVNAEMLKHLKDLVQWMDDRGEGKVWPENLVLKSARAAIAKAEGKD